MTKRAAKLEVRKDTDDPYPDMLWSMLSVKRKTNPRKTDVRKTSDRRTIRRKSTESISDTGYVPMPTNIFIYLKLLEISNLPATQGRLSIALDHPNHRIKLMNDEESSNLDLADSENRNKTFNLAVAQDSLEELNQFSDMPVSVTIYKHIYRRLIGSDVEEGLGLGRDRDRGQVQDMVEDEEDGDEEGVEYEDMRIAILTGLIDIMQFFCNKRSLNEVRTLLYPIKTKANVVPETARTLWEVYTLLPLLKEATFCNMIFISLESLYNMPPNVLLMDPNSLQIDISLRSKIPNEERQYDKIKICNFSKLTNEIIFRQNVNFKWESIKHRDSTNLNTLGIYTGCTINLSRLFHRLFCTEGVNFLFDEIDLFQDTVLVCNSSHRYVLAEDVQQTLHDAIAFNEQEMVLEVFSDTNPNEILMQGTLDLSIFLYPLVNAVRFAVDLHTEVRRSRTMYASSAQTSTSKKSDKSTSKGDRLSTKSTKSTRTKSIIRPNIKPSFAIISICILNPITESIKNISIFSKTAIERENLRNCNIKKKALLSIEEDSYRMFDELVCTLSRCIVLNQVKAFNEGKVFLCAHFDEMSNILMKLVACDFNKRFPTKTNAEFRQMMTTVYRELEQRIHDIVQKFDLLKMNTEKLTEKTISFLNIIKYMHEVGNDKIANFLLQKIQTKYSNMPTLNFALCIWDVERERFEAARLYFKRPSIEREFGVEYYLRILTIYMDYVESLQIEERQKNAFENLLDSLRDLHSSTSEYAKDVDLYILLYCLYTQCGYVPGISFTRWNYENYRNKPRRQLPEMPITRWKMYNSCSLSTQTQKGGDFLHTIERFLELGLYKFAEIVYSEISAENLEIERYFMETTFKILLNNLPPKFTVRTFSTDKLHNGDKLTALNAQINGNAEMYAKEADKAMKSYSRILDIGTLDDYKDFQLGLFHFGYNMCEAHHYERAISAFKKCCCASNCLVPYFEVGRMYYKLNCLSDALEFFIKATNYEMHMPDIWAYLALVNLKLGKNFNALECWKYAKLNPQNVIDEEILEELSKIKIEDINLYVDIPNIPA